jgi:hypothetical protein
MKFRCTISWVHSGNQEYRQDILYDITPEQFALFFGMKNTKNPIGALKYFSPVDDTAKQAMQKIKNTPPEETKEAPETGKKAPETGNKETQPALESEKAV